MPESQAPRPSIPSSVPKSGGGTPYIVGAGVLLVLITAMLWFKLRKSPPPAPTPVIVSASATATSPEVAFDLPPPPEIEAGVDAEADAGKKAGGPATCPAKCEGTTTAALSSALNGASGPARGCYERALRNNPMIQGRLKITVRIGANGTVCNATATEDSLNSAEVTNCVLAQYRGRPFPPPSGGSCLDVNVPLSFTPREGKK